MSCYIHLQCRSFSQIIHFTTSLLLLLVLPFCFPPACHADYVIEPVTPPTVWVGTPINFTIRSTGKPFEKNKHFILQVDSKEWLAYEFVSGQSVARNFPDRVRILNTDNSSFVTFQISTHLDMYLKNIEMMVFITLFDRQSVYNGTVDLLALPVPPTMHIRSSSESVASPGVQQSYKEGQEITIQCNSSFLGLPPRRLDIQLDRAEPIDERSIEIKNEKDVRIIQRYKLTWLSDGATVHCKLDNDFDITRNLSVLYGPRDIHFIISDARGDFVSERQHILYAGTNVTCVARGNPRPDVRWMRIGIGSGGENRLYERDAMLFEDAIILNKQNLSVQQNISYLFLIRPPPSLVNNGSPSSSSSGGGSSSSSSSTGSANNNNNNNNGDPEGENKEPSTRSELNFVARCMALNSIVPRGATAEFYFEVRDGPPVLSAFFNAYVLTGFGALVLLLVFIFGCCLARKLTRTKNTTMSTGGNARDKGSGAYGRGGHKDAGGTSSSSVDKGGLVAMESGKGLDDGDATTATTTDVRVGLLPSNNQEAAGTSTFRGGHPPPSHQPAPSSSLHHSTNANVMNSTELPLVGRAQKRYYYDDGEPIPTEV